MADFNNIELRSEKVRNIIGKVPPEIIRTGIGDITVILLILILAAFFIPYPENIKATATVTETDVTGCIHAEVLIPYRYITKVKKEMPVEMEFEGYEAGRYGYPHGKIVNCANTITVMEGNNFFKAEIIINNKHASYPILSRILPAIAPVIKAGVITANIIWNKQKTIFGICCPST